MHCLPEASAHGRVDGTKEVVGDFERTAEDVLPVVDECPDALGIFSAEHDASLGDRHAATAGALAIMVRRLLRVHGLLLLLHGNLQLARGDELERGVEVFLAQEGVLRDLKVRLQCLINRLEGDAVLVDALLHGGLDEPALLRRDVPRVRGALVFAALADRGKDFHRNPALEALGALELGAEDQGVEAAFVHAVDGLLAALGVDLGLHEVFGVNAIIDAFRRL